MNLPWNYLTLEELCNDIKAGKPWSISRYGDGEFYWIVGVPGFTSRSGHHTIEAGSEELRQTLLDRPPQHDAPLHYAGPLFFRNYGTPEREAKWKNIENWIRGNNLQDIRWVSNLLFVKGAVRAAITRQVFPLLAAVRQVPTVVVGPSWLRDLERAGAFKPRAFVAVPQHDCWLAKDRIKSELLAAVERIPERPLAVSLSCSYLANILVHELYPTLGRDCWLMDVGSVWDNYVGIIQRGFHVDIKKVHGGVVL